MPTRRTASTATTCSILGAGSGRGDFAEAGGGNDQLDGGPGHDVLNGGPGNDVDPRRARATTTSSTWAARTGSTPAPATTRSTPGPAPTRFVLGEGNDILNLSVDGARDTIDCGPGADKVSWNGRRDPRDTVTGCETLLVGR